MVRYIAWGAAGLVAVFVGVTFLLTQIRQPADRLSACLAGSVAGGDIGGPFTLTDETGAVVTDQDVITGPTLMYFGFTFCPDFCPMDAARNADAIYQLDAQGITANALFVSVDPDRDTPEYLAEYTDAFHDRMLGLTGTPEQIAEVAKTYRVYYKKAPSDDPEFYLVDHMTLTYLVTPEDGFVTFFRSGDPAEAVAEKVACIVNA